MFGRREIAIGVLNRMLLGGVGEISAGIRHGKRKTTGQPGLVYTVL
jgi:hypothetical protein